MNFAKKLLKKYGWNEGDGLGKNKNGISKPLRANLKFDTAGFGEDKGAEFTNNWWERVFDEAANKISVNVANSNVEIAAKDENFLEAKSAKQHSPESTDISHKYCTNFIRKSTLNGLNEDFNDSDSSLDEKTSFKYKQLTDEELLQACGGRTAHKGARHGLNLSGKLSRVEKQDQEILLKMQNEDLEHETDWQIVKSKGKKRKVENVDNDSELKDNILFVNEYYIKSKKKKKKEKILDQELANSFHEASLAETITKEEPCEIPCDILTSKKEKKRNHKIKGNQAVLEGVSDQNLNATSRTKKKQKKERKPDDNTENFISSTISNPTISQKRTKKTTKE